MSTSMAVPVLNHSGVAIHRFSVKHAVRMLVRRVVVAVEEDPNRMFGPYPMPLKVRLVRDVFLKFMYNPAVCTKAGVLRRDRNQCAYCGKHATTVDHVQPRSRGGQDVWSNLVAACEGKRGCNARKGNRTPSEAGMPLLFTPWTPPSTGSRSAS